MARDPEYSSPLTCLTAKWPGKAMASKIMSPHLLRHAFPPGVIRAERERMSIDCIVVTRGPAPAGSLGCMFGALVPLGSS
jgi:hypothetical protein